MNKGLGIVVVGLTGLALLIAVWVLPQRARPEAKMFGSESVETGSKAKTSPAVNLEQGFKGDLRPDDPMSKQDPVMDVLTLEKEVELEIPQEEEVAQYARVTANMSMTQMAELQNLRQGTIVRDAGGQLKSPYAEAEKCDTQNICKTIIINTRSDETVWDGGWVMGYTMTGVGMEVVRKNR